MRKTLRDLAEYLKIILVPEPREAYKVKPLYKNIAGEDNIRQGAIALRAFLVRIYDALVKSGDAYDEHQKIAHEYENRTTLSGYYPFLHIVRSILVRAGYYGALTDNAQQLVCSGIIFNDKLPVSKIITALRFLGDCGVVADGIDLAEKKQDLGSITSLKISYPADPNMLTGLKVMAVAEIDFGTLENQDVFLRCDHSVLKDEKTEAAYILKDTIKPLPAGIRDFVLELHERYTGIGFKCAAEIKGFYIYVKYSYKSKEILGINQSLNNGLHINIKAQSMHRYPDIIDKFPPALKEIITKGYGCGRKRVEIGHCDGGCRGMIIPLDNSVLDMRNDIEAWLDQEFLALQKK